MAHESPSIKFSEGEQSGKVQETEISQKLTPEIGYFLPEQAEAIKQTLGEEVEKWNTKNPAATIIENKHPAETDGILEKFNNLPSKVRKILQVFAVVASLSGVVESSVKNSAIVHAAELHEQFNAEREADAFLGTIASLDIGIDDAEGRHNLEVIIEDKFAVFALALDTRTPYFSRKGSHLLSGSVSYAIRERARQYLLPKLQDTSPIISTPGIEILKRILVGSAGSSVLSSDDPNAGNRGEPDSMGMQPSEIRRSRMKDW
jgi:hypothetical protein